MKKGLIIFDMDGTLVDSSIDITASVNYVRSHFGLPELDVNSVVNIINGDRYKLAFNLYEVETYTPKHRKLFEEHYLEQCVKNISLYDGIEELLSALKDLGYKLAVATNAFTQFAQKMLSHVNIDHYFDLIVGSCMVKNPKPSPDMIHYIIDKTREKAKVVMIGDNHTDIYAAKNAEIEIIFADWGFGKIDTYASIDLIASTPERILDYLE